MSVIGIDLVKFDGAKWHGEYGILVDYNLTCELYDLKGEKLAYCDLAGCANDNDVVLQYPCMEGVSFHFCKYPTEATRIAVQHFADTYPLGWVRQTVVGKYEPTQNAATTQP